MSIEQIQEKIQKLLRLASGTNNPEEAGAATAMANRLMKQYKIDKINLGENISESFQTMFMEHGQKSRKTWLDSLGTILGQHFGVVVAIHGSETLVFGKTSNIETFLELYAFTKNEIQRLVVIHATGRGKRFANSFRLGAVIAIRHALEDERKKFAQENVHEKALVVIDNEYAEAMKALMKETGQQMGTKKNSSSSDKEGFARGYQAGREIHGQKNKRVEC